MHTFAVTIRHFSARMPARFQEDKGPWERRDHPDGVEDYGYLWFGGTIGEFEIRASDEPTARRLAQQMAEDFPQHELELRVIDRST